MSSSSAQDLDYIYYSLVFLLNVLLLVPVFCLSRQLKQEEDKNSELRGALSTERQAAASREDSLRQELRWARGDLEFTESLRKCAKDNARKFRSKLAASKADRDRISATLQTTRKELGGKKAAVKEANTKISLLSAELLESLEKGPQTTFVAHQHECAVCMNADADALFPCGHVACCITCALKLPTTNSNELEARCPFCREKGQPKKLYFA